MTVCIGRDPLVYVTKKVDIAGVASVLKGYFRELAIPLFPTQNYKAFISCTRKTLVCTLTFLSLALRSGHEDIQNRVENIQNILTLVHPTVVKVMRYLFKFLYRYYTALPHIPDPPLTPLPSLPPLLTGCHCTVQRTR